MAVAPTCPSDQTTVNGATPPNGLTVICPVHCPKHKTFVIDGFATIGGLSKIVIVIVVSQVPASNIVTSYTPAYKLLTS